MIIQCDKCATRYRLDESRVTGSGVKVRCTKCQNVFMVAPPVEEAHIEEVLSQEKGKSPASSRPQAKKEEKPAQDLLREKPAAKKALDNETLRFNFERPPEESSVDTPGINNEKIPAPDTSFVPDFGFKAAEKEPAKPDEAPSGRKSHFEDLDFSFGDDEGANKAGGPSGENQPGETKEWNIGPGKEDIKAEEKQAQPPKIEPPAAPPVSAPPVKEPVGARAPATGYTKEGKPAGKFEDILSSITDGEKEPEKNEAPVAPPPVRRLGVKYYIIAAAVALIAATAFYFTGGIDRVTGKILSSSSAKHEEPVRIDTVRGYFVDNRNIGRVFVIEAWIKNISDSPQDIKEVRGVLYNNSGEKIKVQPVSPGRVISVEDIKNLSREDILKQYRDVSGGTVPPKGAVPVTIVFTDIPKGMAEYGVDIVRSHS